MSVNEPETAHWSVFSSLDNSAPSCEGDRQSQLPINQTCQRRSWPHRSSRRQGTRAAGTVERGRGAPNCPKNDQPQDTKTQCADSAEFVPGLNIYAVTVRAGGEVATLSAFHWRRFFSRHRGVPIPIATIGCSTNFLPTFPQMMRRGATLSGKWRQIELVVEGNRGEGDAQRICQHPTSRDQTKKHARLQREQHEQRSRSDKSQLRGLVLADQDGQREDRAQCQEQRRRLPFKKRLPDQHARPKQQHEQRHIAVEQIGARQVKDRPLPGGVLGVQPRPWHVGINRFEDCVAG